MDKIDEIKKNENTPILLALLIGFLAGALFGFLISPIKKGIHIPTRIAIGSYNGTNNRIADSGKQSKKM